MKKQLCSLLCLVVLATAMPSCKKRKSIPKKSSPETMIETKTTIIAHETAEIDTKNAKF